MQTTRRAFMGAATVAGAAAAAVAATPPAKVSGPASDKGKFYVAACTPCDKNLKFDEGVYKDMMAWFKDQGADGVVVLGTTGEYPSFSVAERKRVAETALKHRNGLLIIVSSGTPNFPETIELATHAAANGANGLLIIPPFYYKNPPLAGLTKYYSLIFEQVKIPINLYHIPGTSAVPISHELLHSLEHYPNLAGIKDSTGSAEGYAAFVKEFPNLNMRTGTGNNLKPALEAGMGAILAEGNIFTKQAAAVFAAHRAGKSIDEPLAKLRAAQQLLRPGGVGSYGPMKYALSQLMGTRQTYQRPPHPDVTDEQKTTIKAKIEELKQMA
ncbi:MAG TPA: dihydrodipicolinate synthase family protein [Bryobacteraceae bacterium]|nr:Dihydrodipicolinate synthetase [Candidatus Sulfopaludibacter sp. SbA4]HYW48121.1 dihydrodipicolinate synthase family protein [Bryobacteraceae bacterium]